MTDQAKRSGGHRASRSPRTIGGRVLIGIGAVLMFACTPPEQTSPEATAGNEAVSVFATTGHYTTKTPYAPPGRIDLDPVPEGFRPLMVQHVARHGSRPLSSADDDDLSYQIWKQAEQEGALTPLGALLGPVLEEILAVHARIGYGAISLRGAREHEDMARRLLERQGALFDEALANERRVRVLHSGRERAEMSATAFLRGLESARPDLAPIVDAPEAAPETVYFSDAAQTPAADAYRRYREDDERLEAMLDALLALPDTRQMARRMLTALYAPDFVDRLAAGEYRFEAAADPEDYVDDEVEAAAILFGLYTITSNLDLEADFDFGRFIDPEAAAWFAYVDDAESFYERGPAFDDEDVTWRAAEVLAEDMLAGIEAVASGERDEAAVLRFSHAQALIPLAAWLGIEGASEALPAVERFSYDNSAWRSATVSPMGANVQWDVYSDERGTVLLRMLHQERPAAFRQACRAFPDHAQFYALEEIRRCMADRLPTRAPAGA